MANSILLRFSLENYRSFTTRKSISFIPASIKDSPITNVMNLENHKYLRTSAIYGANSSGKSNLIKAMGTMKLIVRSSVKINKGDELPYDPFLLHYKKNNKPTLFEAEFLVDGILYRYGFTYTKDEICDEWLIRNNSKLYLRTVEGIGVNEELFPEGKDLEERTNSNRLFLSVVGQLGGDISNSIVNFFSTGMNVISGLETDDYRVFTQVVLKDQMEGHLEIINFFNKLQLGFSNLKTTEHVFDASEIPADIPRALKNSIIKKLSGKKSIDVFSSHGIYDDSGKKVATQDFVFEKMESEGTQKIFDLAGPIFDTINNGAVLIVDELDAKMHPLISQELVSLFNSPIHNPNGAQLIFTTHDTNLLSSRLLRRDQIWFTEKDLQERTDLYNIMQILLPDGTKPRGDGNLERNYIRGRYGAIPYIQTSTTLE